MAPICLQLKVISCKDIKAFNFFQKLSIYATVSITSQDPKNKEIIHRYQQQQTPVEREGDGNPEWNHQTQFDLNQFSSSYLDNLFLEFDLLCEGLMFGNKTVGQVRVPIMELVENFGNGALRFVTYQVMTTDGKPNGVLDFSYKVIVDQMGNDYPVPGFTQHPIYPPLESIYSPLPSPPATTGIHYPPQGVYYTSPPQTPFYPTNEVSYYPPPPPMVYPPPRPYESSASGEHSCNAFCPYTGRPFPPYPNDTWPKGLVI